MIHQLELGREALHGCFSRDLPPALTIDSGDGVRFRTLDAGWGLEPPRLDGAPRRKFEPRDPGLDGGHCLMGPIAVRGAEPGMTLEVRINALRPGAWGWNVAGAWHTPVNDRLGVGAGEGTTLIWSLDPDARTGRDQHGHQVTLRPHLGILGLPPDQPGRHSTVPPRFCGGNMDCKEFGAGASVFLPIAVAGALFSAGDGHALMADGEVSSTGIECPMEVVDLTLTLHPELKLTTPRARTPDGWLTLGFHEDLDEAAIVAVDAMLALMGELHGLPRREALALASLTVDLHITQIVNGVRGVHAFLPDGAIK